MQIEKQEQSSFEPVSVDVPEHEVSSSEKSRRPLARILLFVGIVVGVLMLLTFVAYRLPITNRFTRAVISVIPYPAAMVDGHMILMDEYANEYDAIMHYMSSTDSEELPDDSVIQQTIMNALLNKTVIRLLAKEYGVTLDQSRVDQFYQDVIAEEESEELFIQQLEETFGWSQKEFQERIISSIVLALQMSEYVLADQSLQADARANIENELAYPGTSEEVEIGDRLVSDLPSNWTELLNVPIGERTGILESDGEYAILTVVDRSENEEGQHVVLKGVVIPKITLEDVVTTYLQSASVTYFVQ